MNSSTKKNISLYARAAPSRVTQNRDQTAKPIQEQFGQKVIDAFAEFVVKNRMDLGGAKWHLLGAEAILCLRSLLLSGDWDEYWAFQEQREMQRVHAARYAGAVPDPLPALGKAA